jgi:hypothetical protein
MGDITSVKKKSGRVIYGKRMPDKESTWRKL